MKKLKTKITPTIMLQHTFCHNNTNTTASITTDTHNITWKNYTILVSSLVSYHFVSFFSFSFSVWEKECINAWALYRHVCVSESVGSVYKILIFSLPYLLTYFHSHPCECMCGALGGGLPLGVFVYAYVRVYYYSICMCLKSLMRFVLP